MAPPKAPMHPGRHLAFLGLLFVILYALVFFGPGTSSMSWMERLEPKLGLDLVGGTRQTLLAVSPDGKAPDPRNLELARQIIENRVNSQGVSEAEVVVEGNANIVISVPGENNDAIRNVGAAAELRFRKVLDVTQDTGDVEPAPTPSASGSATPSGSASATPSASGSATPSASASPSASGSGSATATPSASVAPRPGQADVERKVGKAAWDAAMALQAPVELTQDPAQAELFAPFKALTSAEVAALPANIQFNVPYVTCAKLDDRPAGSIKDENQQAVACEGPTKYLLDKAKVLGTDVTSATAGINPQDNQWVVNIEFSGAGQDRWTKLTQEAVSNTAEPKCAATALGNQQHCLVAVVLDNKVVSAPQVISVQPGGSQISGSFTRSSADTLASQLRYGALPLTFEPQEAQSVSATLGGSHLRAGLLAAGIGMLLVIIYSFFYYRLLGSVIFLSLVLSALLTFGMLAFLGREIGFTLTLAGIAGFIVSLGVAADSFVIYFERLKDEIRDGRSPRSAVPRAWARARRTIISANAITILAAVVLYLVSVGSVKGFAFALGIATLLDLVVVFLFRHPIMTMFASTKAFLSPRVSGLGRVLARASDESTTSRSTRVKEA